VRLGPVEFPLDSHVTASGGERRVQVLFRPEDVAIKDSRPALRWPLLGQATVDEAGFSGSIQKIRLRLPPLAGVRTISPPVPFGADHIFVEAIRSQHQARQFPLNVGDTAWVGIRRIHALLHPGLSFLMVTDASPRAAAAVEFGGQIARLAHARVTVAGLSRDDAVMAQHLEAMRERIGSGPAMLELRSMHGTLADLLGRETSRHPHDLVIHPWPEGDAVAVAESILEGQEHPLLLVPSVRSVPQRVLICAAAGEAGKHDVSFTGRLIRHFGATATVLSVVSEESPEETTRLGERFLAAAARTLSVLGVPQRTILRGPHDMVVMGAPLPDENGHISLGNIVGGLIEERGDLPILIIRADLSSLDEDTVATGALSSSRPASAGAAAAAGKERIKEEQT
jgi:hypothetical protein